VQAGCAWESQTALRINPVSELFCVYSCDWWLKMNHIHNKIWTAWSKFRFFSLPVEKRVRLEVSTDGRHVTFILVSLYESGYGVQVVGSPAVFRELICLRKSAPIPFVIGGKEMKCGISISDKSSFEQRGHLEHGKVKQLVLDYDFFSGLTTKTNKSEAEELTTIEHWGRCEKEQPKVGPKGEGVGATESKGTKIAAGPPVASQAGASESDSLACELADTPVSELLIRSADAPASSPATSHSLLAKAPKALRMPYFMHHTVYHRGLHKSRLVGKNLDSRFSTLDSFTRRRFRIGFFGTHDRDFYTKHYHFPGMNRFEILEAFVEKFGDTFVNLQGAPREWNAAQIVVAIDSQGGDRKGKTFLSQDHYFAALRECDFVLSPPGWCMPLSHNLIEAMFCGAIPITNAQNDIGPELSDGENCLNFQDKEGLVAVIKRALAMDTSEVLRMRQAVRDFYQRYLEPKSFAESVIHSRAGKILLNAEEKSVLFVFPGNF